MERAPLGGPITGCLLNHADISVWSEPNSEKARVRVCDGGGVGVA